MRPVAALLACLVLLAAEVFSQSSWQKITLPPIDPSAVLNSVTASGNLALASISGDAINKSIRSTDGGQTWEPPLTVVAPLKLKAGASFLYGVRGDSIMTSGNGGISWSVARPAFGMNLADVHFISPTQAWAVGTTTVGDTPVVAASSNGWGGFSRDILPADSVLMIAVQFLDNNYGFSLGRSTKAGPKPALIFRTSDGGTTWQNESLPDPCASAPVLAFDFVNPRVGWAVQTCLTTASLYKTTDSGASWSSQGIIDPFFQASAMDAVDSLYAWVAGRVGTFGRIAKTSDGGAGWGFETVPTSGRLISLAMKDTTVGFACGEAASLLVYSPVTTAVPGDRQNRPRSFELSQNYPNPFNGETRIVFSLQKSQPVTLTVYNILGQPVRTLVESMRAAGKNEVSWDGKDASGRPLSSGVYFYKLETRDEKQIRKMVLLK